MNHLNASSTVVNRTHRVVRAQANDMRERRRRRRSLWLPMLIFSPIVFAIFYAIWAVMANYDSISDSIPDSSDQLALLSFWTIPITVAIIGLVWLRRDRLMRERGGAS